MVQKCNQIEGKVDKISKLKGSFNNPKLLRGKRYLREAEVFDRPLYLNHVAWQPSQLERKMENAAILREWFDQVDSGKTGNITEVQLKVWLLFQIYSYPYNFNQNTNRRVVSAISAPWQLETSISPSPSSNKWSGPLFS